LDADTYYDWQSEYRVDGMKRGVIIGLIIRARSNNAISEPLAGLQAVKQERINESVSLALRHYYE